MSDLVEIDKLIPDAKLDIRYATLNNFTGRAVYSEPRALLVSAAADYLVQAATAFRQKGLGIWVWDAYRPLSVTQLFWELTPKHLRSFVGNPSEGSIHNRACAVDMTLYNLSNGEPLKMPSEFDEFTDRARMSYVPKDPQVLRNRDELQQTMEAHRFKVYQDEWWHYNFVGFKQYPVLDVSFEELP